MSGVYEAGLAINCLSNIVTEDLARDLLPDLTNLTSHPQPYLRKKAILCLFKLFVKYPQGLRLAFDRIQQCLDDSNSSVVSCAVNVITELSDKNPKNYLHLAPQFFRLLTHSSNNWMLIKVVKLLGSLVPEEPRLARKLLEPLSDIVRKTQAKSLLYEAVRTITLCLPYCRKSDGSMPPNVPEVVDLCARTLRDFVEQSDQNLKYLGLVGFGSLMQSNPHVLSATNYRPLILACLSDQDVTIRNRALELMPGMVSRKNLMELVTQLITHVELATGTYKSNLVAMIVDICSSEKYSLLQDFSWYLDILFQLSRMRGIENLGPLLRAQIMDVALRVLPVRPYSVRRSIEILLEKEGDISDDLFGDNGRGKHIMPQILPAMAWIVGEYSDLIAEATSIDPEEDGVIFMYNDQSCGTYHSLIQCLLDPLRFKDLPSSTTKVFVQASMKMFAASLANKQISAAETNANIETLRFFLPVYIQSMDIEVRERAFMAASLLLSLRIFKTTISTEIVRESTGDLLGTSTIEISNPKNMKTLTSTDNNKVSIDKTSSAILSFVLKPAPMKPVGLKHQRKKMQNPMGVSIDLLAPANFSIFDALICEEERILSEKNTSLESVGFVQQRQAKVDDVTTASRTLVSTTASGIYQGSSVNTKLAPGSGASLSRQTDPFYLGSHNNNVILDDDRQTANRFGTIQLSDSDEDKEVAKKQKHKKKDKSSKKTKGKTDGFPVVSGGLNMDFPVYESDDDDTDVHQMQYGRKGPGKEFEGLARVDLTAPLRDDEVMPVRQHRVTPSHSKQSAAAPQTITTKNKKKHDKSKKSNKSDAVGDLLDLGSGFVSVPNSTAVSESNISSRSSNAVNLAFDDLFLSNTTSTPSLGPSKNPSQISPAMAFDPFLGQAPVINQKLIVDKDEPLWIKANLKSSTEDLLSKATVMFQCYDRKVGNEMSVFLIFRVTNESAVPLTEVSLDLKQVGMVKIGTVAPGSSSDSAKVGPFTYSSIDSAEEVKGTFHALSRNCVIKLQLPVSFHMMPEPNLTLDQVAQELATGNWHSHSVKIEFISKTQREPFHVKNLLRQYLHAADVLGSDVKPANGTYAARSANNTDRLRILIKVKEKNVKIDIKSTSSTIAKAISSDLKRIIL